MSSSTSKEKVSYPLTTSPTCEEGTARHVHIGYNETQLRKNRSLFSTLGMALAIAAIPYGIGGPLMSSIYGGGQLSIFLGLIVVLILDGCVALSLAELASRYPTSSGIYYWTHQLAGKSSSKNFLSYITGWCWLIGNWTIALSVNFGFASLLAATVAICQPQWTASEWELLLIYFALCILVFCKTSN